MLVRELRRILRRLPFGRIPKSGIAPPAGTSGVDDNVVMPRTEADIVLVAGLHGMTVPDACMPGVIANLALLDTHADILLGRPRRVAP